MLFRSRTFYPLMSLHDPVRFADIVRGMIDIQKHEGALHITLSGLSHGLIRCHEIGWLPECRSATVQQLVQGGSGA